MLYLSMHYMGSDKAYKKKQEGNRTSDIDQTFDATSPKAEDVRPPTSHLKNYRNNMNKTCKTRRRSKEELISEFLLWIPSRGHASIGAKRNYNSYLHTWCSLEDLLESKYERDEWWERVREICASSMTWWWWLKRQLDNTI